MFWKHNSLIDKKKWCEIIQKMKGLIESRRLQNYI